MTSYKEKLIVEWSDQLFEAQEKLKVMDMQNVAFVDYETRKKLAQDKALATARMMEAERELNYLYRGEK